MNRGSLDEHILGDILGVRRTVRPCERESQDCSAMMLDGVLHESFGLERLDGMWWFLFHAFHLLTLYTARTIELLHPCNLNLGTVPKLRFVG